MRNLTEVPARRVSSRYMKSSLQERRCRQVVHPIKEKKREKTVRHRVGAVGQMPSGSEGGERSGTNSKVEEAIKFDIG